MDYTALKVATLNDQGQRKYNQDAIGYTAKAEYLALAVADGCGAYEGSEYASQFCVDFVLKQIEKHHQSIAEQPKFVLNDILIETQNALALHVQELGYPQAQTTFALVLLQDNHIVYLHVGDSRIYRFNAHNETLWHSRDHSEFELLLQKKLVKPQEALHHPAASMLLRTVNAYGYCEPEIRIGKSMHDKLLLFVASDGVWPFLNVAVLRQMARAEDTQQCLHDLFEKIKADKQDFDNMSAGVILV